MDLMTIRAILTLDSKQYESEIKKSQSLAGKLGSGLKSGLGVAAKAAAAGIAAAGAAAVALGKQALSSYANYEQLVGGVETLFGAQGMSIEEYAASVGKTVDEIGDKYNSLMDAQNEVLSNASEAYKTAGLSANEYMETVTSFSASLIQSLGGDTASAARYADMAIVDMSDNANKMGTDMTAIQNAYQGFAKQNYTMLDNLKLGYGGTKGEMERLIEDANKLRKEQGLTADLTIDSYADVVEAIHTVQTQMGITGTTAKEAASTIQGSVNMTKSAWSNLVAGIADDNADLDTLINNFIDSVLTTADNILPRIASIMNGLGNLVTQGAQRLLPVIIDTIVANLPQLISTGIQLVISLITGIIQAIPQLVAAIPQIFAAIMSAFQENWPAMREAGVMVLRMVVDGIASLMGSIRAKGQEVITTIKSAISGKLAEARQAGQDILNKIKEGFTNAMSSLTNLGQQVVQKIKDGIASAWGSLSSWFNGIWNNLFGNRNVNVNVSGTQSAIGIDYVPVNGFPAFLHRGEAVLTAREADQWRRGMGANGNGGITINQYIQSVPQTPVQFASATEAYFEQARWAFV